MAYVRKTDTLVSDIFSKLSDMSVHAQNAVRQPNRVECDTPIYHSIFKAIEDAAWALNPKLKDVTPDEWKYKAYRTSVAFERKDATIKMLDFVADDKVPLALPIAPRALSRYNDSITVPEKYWDTAVTSWFEKMAACDAKVAEVNEQYESVRDQLRSYLKTKSSLNVALKDMPELELYVPASYMERINEVTAPRVKAVVEEADEVIVDREQLASLGIAHRLTVGAT